VCDVIYGRHQGKNGKKVEKDEEQKIESGGNVGEEE